MKSKIDSDTNRKDKLTFTVSYSNRNVAIAKILIITTLSILFCQYFIKNARYEYNRGQEITREEYLENFERYRADLLNSQTYANNMPLMVFISFMVIGFLFGSYELISVLLGLAIGKFIPPRSQGEREE